MKTEKGKYESLFEVIMNYHFIENAHSYFFFNKNKIRLDLLGDEINKKLARIQTDVRIPHPSIFKQDNKQGGGHGARHRKNQ